MVHTLLAGCPYQRISTQSLVLGLVSSLFSSLPVATDFNLEALHAHHTTEERIVFPILGKKIPRFAHDAENGHLDSHRAIHDGIYIQAYIPSSARLLEISTGLVDLMGHVSKWRKNPNTYSPEEMKACLDQLSSVLFKHLDQEVRFAYLSDSIILINAGGGHQRRQIETVFQTGRNRAHRQMRENISLSNIDISRKYGCMRYLDLAEAP
jgi:hypothetical protein